MNFLFSCSFVMGTILCDDARRKKISIRRENNGKSQIMACLIPDSALSSHILHTVIDMTQETWGLSSCLLMRQKNFKVANYF
jgi:hypothetical protein